MAPPLLSIWMQESGNRKTTRRVLGQNKSSQIIHDSSPSLLILIREVTLALLAVPYNSRTKKLGLRSFGVDQPISAMKELP